MSAKSCNKCGDTKPLGDFTKSRGYVLNECKLCAKKRVNKWCADNAEHHKRTRQVYGAANVERTREYKRLWSQAHKDQSKQYYSANAERISKRNAENAEARSEYCKRYYTKTADYQRARAKRYTAANTERIQAYRRSNIASIRESAKQWRDKNPDKVTAKTQRRNARKSGAEGSHTAAEWRALVQRFGGHCVCCRAHLGLKKLTADHVVPLSKGGSNFIENIQPLCGSCNYRKRDRHSTDYRKTFTF